jgi:DNA-binding NtrC family response regulator
MPPLEADPITAFCRVAAALGAARHLAEESGTKLGRSMALAAEDFESQLVDLARAIVGGAYFDDGATTKAKAAGRKSVNVEAIERTPPAPGYDTVPLRVARQVFETKYIASVLEQCEGNVSRAAAMAGMDRASFHRKCRDLGISTTRIRRGSSPLPGEPRPAARPSAALSGRPPLTSTGA